MGYLREELVRAKTMPNLFVGTETNENVVQGLNGIEKLTPLHSWWIEDTKSQQIVSSKNITSTFSGYTIKNKTFFIKSEKLNLATVWSNENDFKKYYRAIESLGLRKTADKLFEPKSFFLLLH